MPQKYPYWEYRLEIEKYRWKTLTKIKDVESFLDFANFYQQFIKDFSHITVPLNLLKEKGE